MRVSVIPSDKIIIVDGNGVTLDDWNFDDDHIHAIQWVHDQGHIELKTNDPNIEINDVSFVQPYIDKYMEIIPIIKEKALKAKEEERLRAQKEESEIRKDKEKKKKENEEIKKLQEQNKKIREEKMRLESEATHLMEEVNNVKLHYDIELERKELEKQAEIETLKQNAFIRELLDKETDIIKNYDQFKKQLHEEIDESKLAQRKFLEAMEAQEETIKMEKEKLKKTKELFDAQVELEKEKLKVQRQMIEEENLNHKYRLDYEKDTAELIKKQLEFDHIKLTEAIKSFEENQKIKTKEMELEKLDIAQKKSQISLESDVVQKAREDFEDYTDRFKYLAELRENEGDKLEDSVKKIELTNEEIKKGVVSSLDYDNVSVEDLVKIMNELDPEKVYTSLTSGEIDENSFPVEKAVTWFSALKKAMDNK
jgi:DNA repair exonuclease SbcCD ATPase subunit